MAFRSPQIRWYVKENRRSCLRAASYGTCRNPFTNFRVTFFRASFSNITALFSSQTASYVQRIIISNFWYFLLKPTVGEFWVKSFMLCNENASSFSEWYTGVYWSAGRCLIRSPSKISVRAISFQKIVLLSQSWRQPVPADLFSMTVPNGQRHREFASMWTPFTWPLSGLKRRTQ